MLRLVSNYQLESFLELENFQEILGTFLKLSVSLIKISTKEPIGESLVAILDSWVSLSNRQHFTEFSSNR
jgi:hypothetical protein